MTDRKISRPRNGYRRIIISAAVGLLPSVTALLTTLVLWKSIAAISTRDEIGLFVICMQAMAYLSLLQFGLDAAATLMVAEKLATGHHQEAADQCHSFHGFNAKIALLIGVMILIAAVTCTFLGIPSPELARSTGGFLIILGLTQVLLFLTRSYSVALAADHHMLALSWLRVVQSFLVFILGLVAFYFGAGIFSLALGELAAQVVMSVVLRGLCRSWCGWIRLKPSSDRRGGEQLRRGAILGLGTLGWAIEFGSDIVLLQFLPHGLALGAVLSLWSRFPNLAQNICVILNNNTVTALKSSWVTDRGAAAGLFRRLILTQIGLSFVVAICVGLWLPSVMHFWLNAEYDLMEGRIMSACLAGSLAARSIVHLLYLGCTAFDCQHGGNLAIWICVAAKVPLALALGFEYGLSGFVIAGFAAWLIAFPVMALILVRAGAAGVKLLSVAFASLGFLWLIPWLGLPYITVETFHTLILGLAITACVAAVAMFAWFLATGVLRKPNFLRKPL